MNQLWAPWRLEYVAAARQPGCVFCAAHRCPAPNRELLVLYRDPAAVVLLNRFPYQNAHLLVCPALHTGDPGGLDAPVFAHLTVLVRRALDILRQEYRAEGFNVGMNLGACAGAGITDHLHWHVVPRWTGDTNFLPVLADVRSIPEHLERTWERLWPAFADLRLTPPQDPPAESSPAP